jgi:hypothetical protein
LVPGVAARRAANGAADAAPQSLFVDEIAGPAARTTNDH